MSGGSKMDVEIMVRIASDSLKRELKHYTEILNKFNKWKYSHTPMSDNQRIEIESMLSNIREKIKGYSTNLILYKKYAENNK